MAARLGDVFYWTGCIVAVLALFLGAGVILFDHEAGGWRFAVGAGVAAFGVVAWLFGLACRYVLAGSRAL